ncbi:MAG: hypothetical protein Q8R39_04265 [bacterium]|nr:hypothetical protein [bacterium]MDZ4284985.1 hypothetical protein [Patescibacteria group bacterium]
MTLLSALKEIGKLLLAIFLTPFAVGMWCFCEWWEGLLKKIIKKKKHRVLNAVLLAVTAPLFIFYPLAWLSGKVVEDF